jgi:hypothetical protein
MPVLAGGDGTGQGCGGATAACGVACAQVHENALFEKAAGNGEPNALIGSRYQGNTLLGHRCMLSETAAGETCWPMARVTDTVGAEGTMGTDWYRMRPKEGTPRRVLIDLIERQSAFYRLGGQHLVIGEFMHLDPALAAPQFLPVRSRWRRPAGRTRGRGNPSS